MYYPSYFPVRPQVNQFISPQMNIENTPPSLLMSPKPSPQSFQPGSYKIGSTGISIKPIQPRENVQPLQQIAQNIAVTSLPAVPVAEKQNNNNNVIPKPAIKSAEPTHVVRKVLQSLTILFTCLFLYSLTHFLEYSRNGQGMEL